MRRERRRISSGADPKKSPGSTVISNEGSRQAARCGPVGRCTSPDSDQPGVRCQLSPAGNGGRAWRRDPVSLRWDPSSAATWSGAFPWTPTRRPRTRKQRIRNEGFKAGHPAGRETHHRNDSIGHPTGNPTRPIPPDDSGRGPESSGFGSFHLPGWGRVRARFWKSSSRAP